MPALSKDTVSQMISDAVTEKDELLKIVESLLITRDVRISDLESKVSNLESENISLNKSVNQLTNDLHLVDIRIDQVTRIADDQNQYSRKQNIIIDGLKIKRSDTDKHIRNLVLAQIRRLDLDIDDYEVDRAHRIETAYHDKNGKPHIPIVVRLTSWYARNEIYEARHEFRKSNIYIRPDLTARRKDLLSDAEDIISEENSGASNLIEFVFVDRNC